MAVLMKERVRVMLVEHDPLFQDLVRIGLSQSGRVEVVGVFSDGASALAAAPVLQPGVALLAMELRGGLNGIQLGRLLRKGRPEMGIVLLTSHRVPAFLSAVPAEELAGWSYLHKKKTRSLEALVRMVEGAAAGRGTVDEELVSPQQPGAGGRLGRLTPRQLEVLRFIAMGFSNKAIAEQMGVARKTVENQINAMYQVLDLDPSDPSTQARVQAVLIYLRETQML